MANGLYRRDDGWVRVEYEKHATAIPRSTYEAQGYRPEYVKLPSETEYRANLNREKEG
jgi:hypothetical protein